MLVWHEDRLLCLVTISGLAHGSMMEHGGALCFGPLFLLPARIWLRRRLVNGQPGEPRDLGEEDI